MIINRNIRLINYKPWVKDRTLDLSSQLWHLWNDFQNSFTKRFLRQHATSGLNFDSISTIFTGNHSSRAVCFVISSFCLVFFGLCVVVLFFITLLSSYACMFVRPAWKKRVSQSASHVNTPITTPYTTDCCRIPAYGILLPVTCEIKFICFTSITLPIDT